MIYYILELFFISHDYILTYGSNDENYRFVRIISNKTGNIMVIGVLCIVP